MISKHMTYKVFSERNCPNQGKKQQSISIKSFYSNTSCGFRYKKTA